MTYPSVRRGFELQDKINFSKIVLPVLSSAADDLEYLLGRGYAINAALSLVGNHYQLTKRQRTAVRRVTDNKDAYVKRKRKQVSHSELCNKHLFVDGFNLLITLETALSGSLVLLSRDGTVRDLAGLRGTYRIIDKTERTIDLLFMHLRDANAAGLTILLDQPVSNSGRLAALIREKANDSLKHHCDLVSVDVILEHDPDKRLEKCQLVATSDSVILDRCHSWYNVAAAIIEAYIPDAWVVKI